MSKHNERMTLGKGGLPGEAKNHALCLGAVIVARVTGGGYPAGVGWSPQSEDTARRLAACWNACAGIPTEALEQGAMTEALLESGFYKPEEIAAARAMLAKLKA